MVLDKDFRIEVDSYNYTLVKERITEQINEKTGNPIVSKDQWHYPTLKMALSKYVDEALRASEDSKEILEKLEDIYKIIDNK